MPAIPPVARTDRSISRLFIRNNGASRSFSFLGLFGLNDEWRGAFCLQ